MKFFRLYWRVLELLGPEARLGWALALAGVALASAAFVEPILFGRIVDTLANAQSGARQLDWNVLLPLVGAWVGFGLFTIVCSTIVSLHADRLAHRHCQAVRADYFEHILQLPLSYHTGTHSGRLMKVMITGTNTLWGLWLSFFREHFTSFVSLFILMPLTLFLNWRYALVLMLLCARLRRADRVRAAQDRKAAEHGRDLLHRPGRAHLRHARQYRADPELRAHRHGSERDAQASAASCSARRCRCCGGGRWRRC